MVLIGRGFTNYRECDHVPFLAEPGLHIISDMAV